MPGRTTAVWVVATLVGCAGAIWGAEPAGRGPWPIPPVPDNAYAVVRPNENPLVVPNSKVPAPTIVWERITVRPDHPRLLFTKEDRPALVKRLRGHPARPLLELAASERDPLARAFLYQISGRESYARSAIEALLEGRVSAADAGYVYDWTYEAMSDAQRKEATDRLWGMVALDRSSGWPRCSPFSQYPDDPRPSETPPAQWAPFYNWTFHDQDWARVMVPSFAALLALAGHHPRAAEGARNYFEYSLKDPMLFLDYLRDGSYWQGYYWWITHKTQMIVQAYDLLRTACGVDYVDAQKHPWVANTGRWVLYCSDPYRKRVIYNYGDGEMVPLENRARLSLAASNRFAANPHVQWLIRTACPPPHDWLPEMLYHDFRVPAVRPDDLPPSRAFPGTGLAVMRSGWGPNDVWASVRFADWFDMHCHGDSGSFLLYCKSPLVPDTGFYCQGAFHGRNYYHRTIAHNTLTIRDPKARTPLNDGCQRLREQRTWTFAVGQAAWVYHQKEFDRGDLLAFEHQPLYDYAAGDAAMAYRPEHLKEFTRQTLFLREGVLLVFDRVETTRPDLEKRWLMHLVGEPKIDGKLLRTEVKGHIEDYDGRLTVSRGSEGAILRCHTLLPAQRRIRRVGGVISDIPPSTLVRVPRTRHRMGTGSRWLWTDPLILYYRDPLSGKTQPAMCFERDNPTDCEYEVTDTKLYLKFDAYERGRVDELDLKLSDFKTLLDLTADIGGRHIWHLPVHYLPGYEYYNEGVNYAPAYRFSAWHEYRTYASELVGGPNERGAWRIEVYPAQPAARDYFFHVLDIQRTEDEDPAGVQLRDAADHAEATVVVGKTIYTVRLAKTGDIGGHVRVTDAAGKVLADRGLARKIVQD